MAIKNLIQILALLSPQVVLADSFSLALARKPASNYSLPRRQWQVGQASEINDKGFWYANWTVGAAKDLVLLIDTGSGDVYLNPGVYIPSNLSTNENRTFTAPFQTTNLNGTGSRIVNGSIYEDVVRLDHSHLSVSQQPLGSIPIASPRACPHDGLIGFGHGDRLNSTTWFSHLCVQGSLDECRFGLAFETDNTGVQYFGKVEHRRFDGPLSKAPLYAYDGITYPWYLYADIAYAGRVIVRDAFITTDSGTAAILGPIDEVAALFRAAGVQYFIHNSTDPTNTNDPTTLTGYFPCDKPPRLGFGFPSISNATSAKKGGNQNVSHHSTIFDVLPSPLEQYRTGNNCTASIRGTDEFGAEWVVGQAFFQGKYIDHNQADNTMGFANLRGY